MVCLNFNNSDNYIHECKSRFVQVPLTHMSKSLSFAQFPAFLLFLPAMLIFYFFSLAHFVYLNYCIIIIVAVVVEAVTVLPFQIPFIYL